MNIYDYIKASESFSDNYKIIPLPELRQYYFKSDIYEFNKVATLLKINGLYYNFVYDPVMRIKINTLDYPNELVVSTNTLIEYDGMFNILIDENNIIQFDYYYDEKYHCYCVSIDIINNEQEDVS